MTVFHTDFYIKLLMYPKLSIFFGLILVFAILYSIADDSQFQGVNKVSETIKDEIIKKKVTNKVNEVVEEDKKISDKVRELDKSPDEPMPQEPFSTFHNEERTTEEIEKTDVAIDDTGDQVKEEVKDEDLSEENIKPSLAQRVFNRFYYSVTTGCLLGYGDVYPKSNYVKTVCMIQALSTIGLIVL